MEESRGRKLNKKDPATQRAQSDSSLSSPLPAPRRSIEEKQTFNQQEQQQQEQRQESRPSSRNSVIHVDNIRKFAGIEDDLQHTNSSSSSNHANRSTGNHFSDLEYSSSPSLFSPQQNKLYCS